MNTIRRRYDFVYYIFHFKNTKKVLDGANQRIIGKYKYLKFSRFIQWCGDGRPAAQLKGRGVILSTGADYFFGSRGSMVAGRQ